MKVNDMTDEFDTRLKAMQAARSPQSEQDLAITTYERLRTCRAIAKSLLSKPSNADVLAVFAGMQSASTPKARRRPS